MWECEVKCNEMIDEEWCCGINLCSLHELLLAEWRLHGGTQEFDTCYKLRAAGSRVLARIDNLLNKMVNSMHQSNDTA